MTNLDTKIYGIALKAKIAELEALDAGASADRNPVILDQTSVGRLSRMDAMQHQAMAQATSQRRNAEIVQAKAALKRIQDGTFGECIECGDVIAKKRLDHNPAVTTCITCARG